MILSNARESQEFSAGGKVAPLLPDSGGRAVLNGSFPSFVRGVGMRSCVGDSKIY
jgi:hypothetical protein